jgi:hypothetical protein
MTIRGELRGLCRCGGRAHGGGILQRRAKGVDADITGE